MSQRKKRTVCKKVVQYKLCFSYLDEFFRNSSERTRKCSEAHYLRAPAREGFSEFSFRILEKFEWFKKYFSLYQKVK